MDALDILRRELPTAGVFVDFDGTLSPIVPSAADARPLPGVGEVLLDLTRLAGRLAVVSGRPVSYLAEHLPDVDALVFAAGAGPGSGPARKMTVDRDGATLLADAAELAGVRRLVVVSAMAADDFEVGSEDVFQIYLRAKAEADEIVRSRDLDWTIVRPGGLTDTAATGGVHVAASTGRGQIPRDDVAEIVTRLVVDGTGVRRQFEVISGDAPITEALSAL